TEVDLVDTDGDGVADCLDNCPNHSNATQLDTDGDGFGDACGPDDDDGGCIDEADQDPTSSTAVVGHWIAPLCEPPKSGAVYADTSQNTDGPTEIGRASCRE